MRLRQRPIRLAAAVFLAAFGLLGTAPATAEAYHVILSGSGGEPEFEQKFRSWGARLQQALVQRLGNRPDRVYLLAEALGENDSTVWAISLDSIEELFGDLSETLTSADDLYVYLIGHGSYLKKQSKFLIPGPDLSARMLSELLDRIPSRRAIILNSTSTSAGFVNALSGPGRVICTATKNVVEVNATEFMGLFVEALEEGNADRNHDERISFLEACQQAAELTATWYLGESLVATEHAILDDNADGLGSRLPLTDFETLTLTGDDTDPPLFDGFLADQCYLKDHSFSANVPPQLVGAYLDAIDAIESLKRSKPSQDSEAYYAELERLLLDAARANREIRRHSAPTSEDS